MNLYQNDGKKKVWRRLGTAHDQSIQHHLWNTVERCDGMSMASSGTGLLLFIDDVTEDRSSRMNSEVYRDKLSAQIQSNSAKLIQLSFIVQMDITILGIVVLVCLALCTWVCVCVCVCVQGLAVHQGRDWWILKRMTLKARRYQNMGAHFGVCCCGERSSGFRLHQQITNSFVITVCCCFYSWFILSIPRQFPEHRRGPPFILI